MPDENDDDGTKNEIIVEGTRPDDGGGGVGGGFWGGGGSDNPFGLGDGPFGGGSGGGGAPPSDPPDDDEEDETPDDPGDNEIIVEVPRPDQSDFADDGDVFNDGSVPTYEKVADWLQSMAETGVVQEFNLIGRDPDNPDVYEGTYSTIDGKNYEFSSDGAENYVSFLRSEDITPPDIPDEFFF